MSQQLCQECIKSKGEYTWIDEADVLIVCDECYDELFYRKAQEGVGSFLVWASQTYGEHKAREIAMQVYGRKYEEWVQENGEDIPQFSGEYYTMFTFGILSYPENIEREGGIDIIENCIVKGHKIYLYNKSFPITEQTDNADDITVGTLFKIPAYVVTSSYDFTEGYDPNRAPMHNMYNREKVIVTTPTGEEVESFMYIANPLMFQPHFQERYLIPEGDFRKNKHIVVERNGGYDIKYHAKKNKKRKKGGKA